MTYSIIPPILVVLSVIGIILFIVKKAPQVARLDDNNGGGGSSEGMEKRAVRGEGKKRGRIKQSFLIFLEKITRKFRSLILKLDSLFTSWNASIRKKRDDRMKQLSSHAPGEEGSSSLDKLRNYGLRNKTNDRRIGVSSIQEPEPRPMISDRVASPQNKVELKDRFEKILIDRIAVNPKDIEAYERLGEYYLEINNLSYAKECFKQVIKLDPTNASAKVKMRKLERILGR